MIVERKSFSTAAQLIATLQQLTAGVVSLDDIYLEDVDGAQFDTLELVQESLSDHSVSFNVILSTEGDPNS